MKQSLETAGASVKASRYDDYAFVQRQTARDLLAYTDSPPAPAILEIGCGTGIYTELLINTFPSSPIEAVDISQEMLHRAAEKIISPAVRFRLADGEELAGGAYDLITSNAAFQWFRNLRRALARYADMLTDGGVLSFSFFGPGTYRELDGVLKETAGTGVISDDFPSGGELATMIDAPFRNWAMEKKRYTHIFPSLRELLLNIKYTSRWGADDAPRVSWDPGTLARTERVYLERHSRIEASYEVYLCRALK